jgi:hypothetical protein
MSQWKPVVGYEDAYEVSDCGEVRSVDRIDSAGRKLKGRVLKQYKAPNGYMFTSVCANGKKGTRTVHSLMAEAFLGDPGDMWVNHKNGVKTDNSLENLEYVTPGENTIHAYKTGLNKRRVLTQEQADEIHWLYSLGVKIQRLADAYSVTWCTASNAAKGRTYAC